MITNEYMVKGMSACALIGLSTITAPRVGMAPRVAAVYTIGFLITTLAHNFFFKQGVKDDGDVVAQCKGLLADTIILCISHKAGQELAKVIYKVDVTAKECIKLLGLVFLQLISLALVFGFTAHALGFNMSEFDKSLK